MTTTAPPTTIADLLAQQRSGATTALALVEQRLAAIAADTVVGALVEVDADVAIAAARALDARRATGAPTGPLHGVPVTVKSAFGVAGLSASTGTVTSRIRATSDAPAVARLRAAGAVVLGTTTVPPGLDGYHADSPLGGRTANPWDPSRTPGGSSGGSAAAVAAGFSQGDLGSDLIGSIRVPAAFCGVVAHRPSQHAVSKRGHLPWPLDAQLEPPLSAAGPMARSAHDVAALLEVLLRDDPHAITAAPAAVRTLRGLRVGVWREEPAAACDTGVDRAIDEFLARIVQAGAVLVPIGPTAVGAPEAAALFERLLLAEIAFGRGGGAPIGAVWADLDAQARLHGKWAAAVAHVDVVVAPAVPVVAPPHGAVQADPGLRARIGRWSAMTNLLGVPCTVVPVGLDPVSALPVAVQVIAPFGRDRDGLAVARLLEDAGVVHPLVPPVAAPG